MTFQLPSMSVHLHGLNVLQDHDHRYKPALSETETLSEIYKAPPKRKQKIIIKFLWIKYPLFYKKINYGIQLTVKQNDGYMGIICSLYFEYVL